MPESTDIELPLSKKAKFPSSCVVCGLAHPDSKIVLTDSAASLWASWFFHAEIWSARVRVEAPACKGCVSSYWRRRISYFAILILSIFAGVYFGGWVVPTSWGPSVRKVCIGGIAVAAIIPYGVLAIRNPLPFHISADESTVSYQFRNSDYAEAFSVLNKE